MHSIACFILFLILRIAFVRVGTLDQSTRPQRGQTVSISKDRGRYSLSCGTNDCDMAPVYSLGTLRKQGQCNNISSVFAYLTVMFQSN